MTIIVHMGKFMEQPQKYKGKVGRPAEFSKKDHDNIVAAYDKTIVLSTIAGLVRRDKDTIRAWLERGKDDLKKGIESEYVQFFLDTKEAKAKKIADLLHRIESGIDKWQAVAWILERCAREDFSINGDELKDMTSTLERLKSMIDDLTERKHGSSKEEKA